jgi:hypothetical protein
MRGTLVDVPDHARVAMGKVTFVAKHRLPQHSLFTDEALADLLDRHPREHVIALTMGFDVRKPEENRRAIHDGMSGADLLRAVRNGRLWLNVVQVHRSDTRYRDLVHSLYDELAQQCRGFVPESTSGTLLISSPNALVYYHVDGPPSLLWHVRGRKRVWVYPPLDEDLVARHTLEDIFSGASHEYVPYRPEFDVKARVIDLEPGDMASWPHNAPHRVTNHDEFNVSLSTEHTTGESRRRARLYCANRFLRRKTGEAQWSTAERGARPLIKYVFFRACKAARLDDTRDKSHTPAMRVDANAPLGCVPLAGPGPELRVVAFDSFEACSSLHGDMGRVNEAAPRPCPFSTVEFLANHVEHNGVCPTGPAGRILLLVAFRGEAVVGYLPLRKVRDRVLGRTREKIEFLVTNDLDRPHLVARREDESACAEAFGRYLRESEREWTFLEFQEQDAASPLHLVSERMESNDYYARHYENASNATIDLAYPSLDAYFRAFSKKMRSNVGRYARRMFEAGEVQLFSSSAPEAMERMLAIYRSVERRSWKRGIDWVVGDHPHRLEFFRGLMRPEQPMRIDVLVLGLDGCPVAAMINGRFLDRMYALQIAYDHDYAELDPGAMMLLVSVKSAIDQRCTAYDLLSGYAYFKERWLARITPSQSVQVYRRKTLHHLKAVLGEYKRRVVARTEEGTARRNAAKEAIVDDPDFEKNAEVRDALRAEGVRLLADLCASNVPHEALRHEELLASMPFGTTSVRASRVAVAVAAPSRPAVA